MPDASNFEEALRSISADLTPAAIINLKEPT
jgi:hypothetical protein